MVQSYHLASFIDISSVVVSYISMKLATLVTLRNQRRCYMFTTRRVKVTCIFLLTTYMLVFEYFRLSISRKLRLMQRVPKRGSIEFFTFAFTQVGTRWTADSSRRAISMIYTSLENSQQQAPILNVYTNDFRIVPNVSSSAARGGGIVVHIRDPASFPRNPYSSQNPWKSLSRSKLDVMEELLTTGCLHVIWIDLDTLVLVDLGRAFENSSSWLIGYQHGSCNGKHNCNKESMLIHPEFDAQGDLWALDLKTISLIKEFERTYVVNRKGRLPRYDLQAYFSIMLQKGILPASVLLHRIIPTHNFGFVCSNFEHPTVENLELVVHDGHLHCPVRDEGLNAPTLVGVLSFTAPTFKLMFLRNDTLTFTSIRNSEAQKWAQDWFGQVPKLTAEHS